MTYNPKLEISKRAGVQLRDLRENAGLTQEEAVRKLGELEETEEDNISVRTWQRWEHRLDSLEKIEKICKALEFDCRNFLQGLYQ
jgi:transcriptional regulator with XRE-family HTH domain